MEMVKCLENESFEELGMSKLGRQDSKLQVSKSPTHFLANMETKVAAA